MSAPTLWEEGRLSGSRVARLAVLAGALVLALDIAITRRPTPLFDIGFVVICVAAALAVRPRDFFLVGVLPPLLLLGLMTATALVHRAWIAEAGDGLLQSVVSGLAHRPSGLLSAYLLTLAVLGIRTKVRRRRAQAPKRTASPAPTLTTSGEPSEKSTTVVGSEPHSPESMTASSH